MRYEALFIADPDVALVVAVDTDTGEPVILWHSERQAAVLASDLARAAVWGHPVFIGPRFGMVVTVQVDDSAIYLPADPP